MRSLLAQDCSPEPAELLDSARASRGYGRLPSWPPRSRPLGPKLDMLCIAAASVTTKKHSATNSRWMHQGLLVTLAGVVLARFLRAR